MRSCPIAQPMPGVPGPPNWRHQAVVAAAGADRALRAERIGGPFEHRARVVIQPAHQSRLDIILDAGASQVGAQRLEVLPRFGIEGLEQYAGRRR